MELVTVCGEGDGPCRRGLCEDALSVGGRKSRIPGHDSSMSTRLQPHCGMLCRGHCPWEDGSPLILPGMLGPSLRIGHGERWLESECAAHQQVKSRVCQMGRKL